MNGRIKFYNEQKGYGFITDTEEGKDIFFHVTGLLEEVKQNEEVQYEVEVGNRGPKAINIKGI